METQINISQLCVSCFRKVTSHKYFVIYIPIHNITYLEVNMEMHKGF